MPGRASSWSAATEITVYTCLRNEWPFISQSIGRVLRATIAPRSRLVHPAGGTMDLNLSPDEIKFRDELRTWLAANAPTDWDERREESMESRFEYLKRWQRKLYEGGWAGISWPKEYGGRGASLMEQVIFWQEMALASAPPLANVLGLGIIGDRKSTRLNSSHSQISYAVFC